MSQERVETVRAVYDEWARGNLAAGTDLYDRDIIFIPPNTIPDGARFVGVDEVKAWVRRWLDAWSDVTMTAEELIDAGDSVVAVVRQRGVGKDSGAPMERLYFQVWTFRGRAAIRLQEFDDRAEALAAAGLS